MAGYKTVTLQIITADMQKTLQQHVLHVMALTLEARQYQTATTAIMAANGNPFNRVEYGQN